MAVPVQVAVLAMSIITLVTTHIIITRAHAEQGPGRTIALEPGRKKSCAFPFMVPPKDHVSTPVNISESLKYTHELAPQGPL